MSIKRRLRKNGISYQITVSGGYFLNKDGNRVQKRYTTTLRIPEGMSEKKALQLAKEKEIELKKKIDLYKYNPDLVLFQDLWENYLNFYASKTLKTSTLYGAVTITEAHILPFFGAHKLSTITTLMVSEFLDDFSKKTYTDGTYSKSYMKSIRSRTHAIFEYGFKIGWLNRNPRKGAYVPKNHNVEDKRLYTLDEIKEIYSHFNIEGIYTDILLFQLYTGLRISEILALTWKDIYEKEDFIDVNKTLTYFKGVYSFTTPKTKYSYRHIYITPSILEILQRQNKDSKIVFSRRKNQSLI